MKSNATSEQWKDARDEAAYFKQVNGSRALYKAELARDTALGGFTIAHLSRVVAVLKGEA